MFRQKGIDSPEFRHHFFRENVLHDFTDQLCSAAVKITVAQRPHRAGNSFAAGQWGNHEVVGELPPAPNVGGWNDGPAV